MYRKRFDSRTADKFVIRMPDGMRGRVMEIARAQRRSMNNVLLQFLEKELLAAEQHTNTWIPSIGQAVMHSDGILWVIKGFDLEGNEVRLQLYNDRYGSIKVDPKDCKPYCVNL